MNKELVYVGFSFQHHGENSGYNQILKHVKYDKIINCQRSFDFVQILSKKDNFLCKVYFRIFGGKLWWVELQLVLLSIFSRKRYVFHIIYGENIYKFLGIYKGKNEIVLTLHQPPEYFKKKENAYLVKHIEKVDKLIVMSQEMEHFFKKLYPNILVCFIPHGIDIDFFTPRGVKKNQILLVGNWLRDFKLASVVFRELLTFSKEIEITVLTHIKNHHHFLNQQVNLLHRIEDDDLLKLYQKTKVVFLPLQQFTANNAILESCACGCQVIVATSLKNIPKKNNSPIIFVQNEAIMIAEEIIKQIEENTNRGEKLNRQFVATNYGWSKIGIETEAFLL